MFRNEDAALSLSRLESREAINANCGFINFHPCFRWLKVTAGNPGELRTRSPGPHVDLVGSRKVDGLNVYCTAFLLRVLPRAGGGLMHWVLGGPKQLALRLGGFTFKHKSLIGL